jgi:hypothetical protein
MWRGPDAGDDPLFSHSTDTLAASFYRKDFESKALRLLKMARAALIYLALAIHSEEASRTSLRPGRSPPDVFFRAGVPATFFQPPARCRKTAIRKL